MLNRDIHTEQFNAALAQLNFELKTLGKLNLQAQGVQAEYFYRRVLNALFGWNLSNANEHSSNAEAVDLVDADSKLVVQVTVSCTVEKVNQTLAKKKTEAYAENGYQLKFIFAGEQNERLKKSTAIRNEHGIGFDQNNDLLFSADLVRRYMELDPTIQLAIMGILDEELASNARFDNATPVRLDYELYLENAYANLSKAKTILYRQPKNLDSFYEPTFITVSDNLFRRSSLRRKNTMLVSTEHVSDVLKLGRRLIIAGGAGAGKSFIMRHLFLDAARTQQEMVPVYVELRAINDTTDQPSVLELAHRSMSRFGLKSTKEQFVRSLSSQKYLFLLDGLDEVSDSYVARLKNSIEDLAERNPLTQVIISSRMVENEFRNWRTFVVADTVRLNKRQALSLVGKLEYDSTAKERFSEQLDARLYEQHKSFASNPLLLTMMLMVFSHKATIPDNLVTFYQQAFETLLREHDATKDGLFRRALRCGLSDDEFKLVFSNFCFTTFMRDNFAFTGPEALDRISAAKKRVCQSSASDFSPKDYLRDLTESVCMLQRDGLKYSFVHRSFQEYFAALYTMNLDDDNKVQRVVMDWLERHPSVYAGSGVYLNALSNLNYDRFVRHVALGPLCDLRDKCLMDESPEYSYLETLYSCIAVDIVEVEPDDYDEAVCLEVISGPLYRLKEWLLHQSGVSRFALAKHRTDPQLTKKYRDDLFAYLNKFPEREATLTRAREDGMADAVLGYWTESRRFFDAIDLLENQYAVSFSASILDDIDAL